MSKRLIFIFLIVSSCQSQGNLKLLGDLSNDLEEVSAAEYAQDDKLLWVIEDSGNSNTLYGLKQNGKIIKTITIENAENRDWEDLTMDLEGNIYIGEFGNNSKDGRLYTIYKIDKDDLDKFQTKAQRIDFYLPKQKKGEDFEAFFILNNYFYIFTKETKTFKVYRVPNRLGQHEAVITTDYNLPGKDNKITSADISDDGKTVVLLNHDKIWKLTAFNRDDFFSGTIEELKFKHESQKEGVCFKTNTTVIITDERNGPEGGNIYEFELNASTETIKQ